MALYIVSHWIHVLIFMLFHYELSKTFYYPPWANQVSNNRLSAIIMQAYLSTTKMLSWKSWHSLMALLGLSLPLLLLRWGLIFKMSTIHYGAPQIIFKGVGEEVILVMMHIRLLIGSLLTARCIKSWHVLVTINIAAVRRYLENTDCM